MNTRSRKAKGRRLQTWVRDQFLEIFPDLTVDDIRSTSMGQTGSDLQLSPKAQQLMPFAVEAKNQEGFRNVYNAFFQAEQNARNGLIPLVVLKSNKARPLVVFEFSDFINFLDERKNNQKV